MLAKAASMIVDSVKEGRSIVLRYHGDCDGTLAAFALEHALLEKTDPRAVRRHSLRAPYYDYSDALRDINGIFEAQQYGRKPPLIIILDNGSGDDDIVGLRKIKQAGAKVIVLDHHIPHDCSPTTNPTSAIVDLHINPYLYGGDNTVCSTMLASEAARLISVKQEEVYPILSAIAGFADKCQGAHFENYVTLAEKHYTRDQLRELSEAIDLELFYLRGGEEKHIIWRLIEDEGYRTLTVQDLYKRKTEFLSRIKEKPQTVNTNELLMIPLSEYTSQGEYPRPGKAVGWLYWTLLPAHPKLIAVGIIGNQLIFRASSTTGFDVNVLVNYLQGRFLHSNVRGGGHPLAGSLNFSGSEGVAILSTVKEFVSKLG